MSEKSKGIPVFQRFPGLLLWAIVCAIVAAGVAYAAHENQRRADMVITQLSSELAVANAELQLANSALETANDELEKSNSDLASANAQLANSLTHAENAIVADLFDPLILVEWQGAVIDTGVHAATCADLPIGIGFDEYLGFSSLIRGGTEPYIRYNLRSDFANPLKASGRYEKVNDYMYVRKDVVDGWESSPNQFVENYCKSVEMGP